MNDQQPIIMAATAQSLPVITFKTDQDILSGSLLRIRASGTTMLMQAIVTRVRIPSLSRDLDLVHRWTRDDMRKIWQWYIGSMSMALVKLNASLPAGSDIEVHLAFTATGDGAPQGAIRDDARYSNIGWTFRAGITAAIDKKDFKDVCAPVTLEFVAGAVSRVEAFLKHDGRLWVRGFDAKGNPATGQDVNVPLATGGTGVVLNCGPGIEAASCVVARDGATGRLAVKTAGGFATVSNAWPVANDGTPVFFGEFHWHTEFSGDGQRRMEDALRSARDELCLDFAGPSDHGSSGGYGRRTYADQAAICKTFNEPGRFCTLPSVELSGRNGHTNICTSDFDTLISVMDRFAKFVVPLFSDNPDVYPLEELSNICPEGKAVVIPHHTNMDSYVVEGVVKDDGRPFWCPIAWRPPAQKAVRLVEIVQGRGSFETEELDSDWQVMSGGFGGSVRMGLAKGYRMGFTGGTDNHCGWPTRQADGYAGLTAVQCSKLDTASIFEGLYNRRCYATTGARIVADATLNGCPMGSELKLAPGAKRLFRIRIRGTAALAAVQIIHCGCVLHDFKLDGNSPDFDVEWADDRPGRGLHDVYYYVRLRQVDGHCAWLSPSWVDLPSAR